MNRRGFTLIELLVVISIISLLSSIILASVAQARIKAQIARASVEMRELSTIIQIVRLQSGKTLFGITGNSCSGCQCETNLPLCQSKWNDVLTALEDESDEFFPSTSLERFSTDVWGTPYKLNENEGEFNDPNWCVEDRLFTAGPDRVFGSGDDIELIPKIPISGESFSGGPGKCF